MNYCLWISSLTGRGSVNGLSRARQQAVFNHLCQILKR